MNYKTFLESFAERDGRYLECPEGHGWLPPRRICPECGARELAAKRFPEAGEVVAITTVRVPTPDFEAAAPYDIAIAEFGPVRLTGQIRSDEPISVDIGDIIGVDVEESATTGERVVVFQPR